VEGFEGFEYKIPNSGSCWGGRGRRERKPTSVNLVSLKDKLEWQLHLPHLVVMKYPEFVGPCSHRDRDYGIGSNFWKFYLIRTSFTLGELVSLVKVFRLFRLEQIFFGVQKGEG
jgi:hypothetical protein